MRSVNTLQLAKVRNDDEYYTKLSDIEAEFQRHLDVAPNLLQGKSVYCPCDHPLHSNFVHYFLMNFKRLGLSRLVVSSYSRDGNGKILDCHQEDMERILDTETFIHSHMHELQGDGDFRSPEVQTFWDSADIVTSNPPFSLLIQFMREITRRGKDCLVLGPQYAALYPSIFPFIRTRRLLIDSVKPPLSFFNAEGMTKSFGNICWFTTFDDSSRHPLHLHSAAWNLQHNHALQKRFLRFYGEVCYQHYNNYDGIDVPQVDAIPSDYSGIMGAPVSILGQFDPNQFEIVGYEKYHVKASPTGIRRLGESFLKAFFQQGKSGHYTPNMRILSIVSGTGRCFIPFARVLIRYSATWRQTHIKDFQSGCFIDEATQTNE